MDINNGYDIDSVLFVGKGYWIKTLQEGSLYYDSTAPDIPKMIKLQDYKWAKIIIQDDFGRKKELFITTENLNLYELPLLPPNGIFDVRFETGRYVESLNSNTQKIILSSLKFPVVITLQGIDLELKDNDNTGKLNIRLRAGEKVK